MRGEVLTAWAQSARTRYELLLSGFSDAMIRALRNDGVPGSQALRSTLSADLYDIASAWLENEAEAMTREIMAMGHDAVIETDRAVDTPESAIPDTPDEMDQEIRDHLQTLIQELDQALRLQIERDVGAVLRSLRQVALTGALSKRRGGATTAGGRGGAAAIAGALAALNFDFLDRSGKRWTSTRHVGVIWRHALLLAWNETALLRAAGVGLDVLEIAHPDAGFGELGTLVATDEEADAEGALPWSEVRDEVFHPNSMAWLRPVDATLSQA